MSGFFSLNGRQTVKTAYRGIPECALPGEHEFIFSVFKDRVAPGAKVLDLASGLGAWASRLADHGYDVVACDIADEHCRVPCLHIDLNKEFSTQFEPQQFDAVTAIEMLEHMENPRHTFRESNKLLKAGGAFVLATPNASGLHSRVKFFFTGRFAMFDDDQYHEIGHIRPLTYWELDKSLSEAGFAIRKVFFKNHYDAIPRSLGEVAKLLSSAFLKPLARGVAGGQVIIIFAEKVRSLDEQAHGTG